MTRLGLVAHDQKKSSLVAWCQAHRAILERHEVDDLVGEVCGDGYSYRPAHKLPLVTVHCDPL